MKLLISALTLLLAGWVFYAAVPVEPGTVVATVNDRKVTAEELDSALAGAPPNVRKGLQNNRMQFLQQYALSTIFAGMAKKDGLIGKTPYKQQLAWLRMQTLWQAALNEKNKEFAGETPEKAKEAMTGWMDQIRSESDPVVENEEYFSADEAQVKLIEPETVIATVNGRKLTAGRLRDVLTGASPEIRQRFRSGRSQFLAQYAMMDRLVQIAEEQKLDKQSPYADQLSWVTTNTLMQAKLNDKTESISIDTKAQSEYYEAHRDQYTKATVKVLYVSFASAPASQTQSDGKTVISEADAKAKIDSIKAQLNDGADFVALVKEHSEDQASRDKDGDFGVISKSDMIPDHIKEAIFSLKAGDVSEVVRQPNGFYLFRAEEIGMKPLKDVLQDVMRDAKSTQFQEWFTSIQDSLDIQYVAPEYFAPRNE